MRNILRRPEPQSLRENGAQWRQELLDELAKGDQADKDRLKLLYRKYAQADVKKTLDSMYNKRCCYCESNIRVVSTPHIEHRKPKDKDKFPELTFDWDNLHLACQICNQKKGSRWDVARPILDAVHDVPISKHLTYRSCHRYPKTGRGKTTREHADLNRTELQDAREDLFRQAFGLIEEHNRDPAAPGADVVRGELQDMRTGQYGSFIDYLIDSFLKSV